MSVSDFDAGERIESEPGRARTMTQPESARLRELVAACGVNAAEEAGRTVLGWLERELSQSTPADWETRLLQATELALAVYWDFMVEYNAFYEDPDGRGAVCVARALRGRIGQADPHMCEAVLD